MFEWKHDVRRSRVDVGSLDVTSIVRMPYRVPLNPRSHQIVSHITGRPETDKMMG